MTDQSDTGQALAADQHPASAAAEAPGARKEREQRAVGRKKSRSRFALRNWRVSWRLIALIAIPTVTAMAFGGVRIQEAMRSATSYQRVETLADLGSSITRLANAMEDERDQLAGYIASGRPKPLPASITQAYHTTDLAAAQVSTQARAIGPSYQAQVQNDLAAVLDRLDDLGHYRSAAVGSKAPALTVIDDYSEAIADLFTLNDQIAQGSSDPTLANNVRALSALSRTEDQATQQRGILYAALLAGQFDPGAAAALTSAQSQQAAEFAEFQSDASIDEQQVYNDTVAGPAVDQAQAMELQAIASSNSATGTLSVTAPAGQSAPAAWNADMSTYVDDIRHVQQGLVDAVIKQSQSLHAQATRTAIETGIEVLAVLIVVLMITIVVARSMVRPLRKLRTGALEVAGLRLPDAVRRMSETDGEGVPLEVEPIDVDSSDEIGEVARAFDQVHREALRLAANEAALRGNVNAMFVNLSRRSQSLVERQIRLIDDLEQGEQDPERLSSLFQMDHLATRMRRNSENLLVLAGHEESRRWNQPVALVDVLRAALSEIEQYERVTLNVQPGIAVRGQAVSDVVHLTAELVENATSFSAAETPVTIAGHLLSSGGVLLEITDQGVGMGAEEMAHANWRLDNPPVVDVAVSRRMGLFVVARLAARHGIRVRLRPSGSGGLVALVWLPDEAIMHEAPDGSSGQRSGSGVPEPVIGPVTDGIFAGAGANGAVSSAWADGGRKPQAEQETGTAKPSPRVASLGAEAEGTGLGPKRVPGAGPRPGAPGWGTTGPLPAFRTVPRPASNGGSEPAVTGPQPVLGPGPVASAGPAADTAAATPATTAWDVAPGTAADTSATTAWDTSAGTAWDTAPGTAADTAAGTAWDTHAGTAPDTAAAAAWDTSSSTAWDPAGGTAVDTSAGTGADPPAAETADSPAVAFDFEDGSQPGDDGANVALGGASPHPVLGTPAATAWEAATSRGAVIVPPPDGLGAGNRLPIFEAVESDWFRRGRQAVGRAGGHDGEASNGWASAADEGWRAAEVVHAPSSGGITSAGLPKRVPRANLVPGAAGGAASSPTAPVRSAAATRDRFASFQRGAREGRAAASSGTGSDGGEDESSG
jgi:signal transduction histidine kinase